MGISGFGSCHIENTMIYHLCSKIFNYADRFGPQEWFWILVGLVVGGAFLLRGFGSRKNY
jgi:hypothetical protein